MSTTGTETTIPFLDLSRQHKEIEDELMAAMTDVVRRGNFVLGEHVQAFEAEWSGYCRAGYCAGVGNGTDAITLALLASGAVEPGRGDEVITTAISAGYTPLAILAAGATPVFAEVDPDTLCIDPVSVERLVSSHTKAIVPVHLYGQLCNVTSLARIADANDLTLIEDAAQAHGAWRNDGIGRSRARIATFSFYPTKNLGACGDGGAVVSDDAEFIARLKTLRQGGHLDGLSQSIGGRNSRLDEIQAGILRVKLRHLDRWNARRATLADRLDQILEQSANVIPVLRRGDVANANHLYVVRTAEREALRKHLRTKRIDTAIHYPLPLHRAELFRAPDQPSLEAAEKASDEVVSLPVNSHTEDWEIEAIGDAILELEP